MRAKFCGCWIKRALAMNGATTQAGAFALATPVVAGPDYKQAAVQLGGDVFRAQNADSSRDHASVMFSTGRITGDVTHADGTDAGSNAINATTVGVYWTHFSRNDWYVDAVARGSRYDVPSLPTRMAGHPAGSAGRRDGTVPAHRIVLCQRGLSDQHRGPCARL